MANRIVSTHIDHATGDVRVIVETTDETPGAPRDRVRWRKHCQTKYDHAKAAASIKAIDAEIDADASGLAAAGLPVDQWTSKLHQAREAEAAAAMARAERLAEQTKLDEAKDAARAAVVEAANMADAHRAEAHAAEARRLALVSDHDALEKAIAAKKAELESLQTRAGG